MVSHPSMSAIKEKRIGIFEYDWSLYSFMKDFAIKLAEAGYLVDIFQKDPIINPGFADIQQLNNMTNIRIINFSVRSTLFHKFSRKISKLLGRIDQDFYLNPKNLLDRSVLRKSRRVFVESQYNCLIGVEKKGLIWAGIFTEKNQIPLIYYSLELYLEDHPGLADLLRTREFTSTRTIEKKYHQISNATIIQDENRAEALLKYNGIGSTRFMYLPISVRGDSIQEKSDFLVRSLKLDPSNKILLYYGLIQDDRFSTAMVNTAKELPDGTVLVMHGYGEPQHLSFLQSIADMEKVRFSLKLVAEEDIKKVIASAVIGLALYLGNNSNDRLAAFSSVKVAYYMQCGVPLIALRSESFTELMKRYQCGELIDSIEEIPQKSEIILKNYAHYREQAHLAFKEYYDFDRNFRIFLDDFTCFIQQPGNPA